MCPFDWSSDVCSSDLPRTTPASDHDPLSQQVDPAPLFSVILPSAQPTGLPLLPYLRYAKLT